MATVLELATMTPQGVFREIEQLAEQVNLTMYGLCQQANVDHTTVQKWRNGEADPSFRIVRKLVLTYQKVKGQIEAKHAV